MNKMVTDVIGEKDRNSNSGNYGFVEENKKMSIRLIRSTLLGFTE